MQLSRKDFLRASGTGIGLALLVGPLGLERGLSTSLAQSSTAGKKAMLHDTTKCVGCRACQAACKRWNNLPPEPSGYGDVYDNPDDLSAQTWTLIKFRESSKSGEKRWLFCKYQCMHCTNASCEAVCPTGAISHQGDAVIIDQEWCIGCGYCIQACPFGVPHKDEDRGTARKCTFCADRIIQGLKPACVEACPAEAIIYGERAELVAEGKRRVQSLITNGNQRANLYGENELGGLYVLYVLDDAPSVYGQPESPQLPTTDQLFKWLTGIATAGVVAALPFWWLFKRKEQLEAEQESKVEGGVK